MIRQSQIETRVVPRARAGLCRRAADGEAAGPIGAVRRAGSGLRRAGSRLRRAGRGLRRAGRGLRRAGRGLRRAGWSVEESPQRGGQEPGRACACTAGRTVRARPLGAGALRLGDGTGGAALCALDAGPDRLPRELGLPDPAGRVADSHGPGGLQSRLADRQRPSWHRWSVGRSATRSGRCCSSRSAGRSSTSMAMPASSPSSRPGITTGAPGSCSAPG